MKSLEKFTLFLENLSNVAILCFLVAFFFAHFKTLDPFFGIFFKAFFAVLSQLRFVVIYALFWVKYFWRKPYLCNKKIGF